MKLVKSIALLVFAGMVASSQAQPASTNAQGRLPRNPEGQLTRLTEQLSLTEAQKPKVKAIIEEQVKKSQELRGDSALSPEERRAKMQAIREETSKKMKDVLTPEQFKKYEEMALRGPRRIGGPEGQGGQGGGLNRPERPERPARPDAGRQQK